MLITSRLFYQLILAFFLISMTSASPYLVYHDPTAINTPDGNIFAAYYLPEDKIPFFSDNMALTCMNLKPNNQSIVWSFAVAKHQAQQAPDIALLSNGKILLVYQTDSLNLVVTNQDGTDKRETHLNINSFRLPRLIPQSNSQVFLTWWDDSQNKLIYQTITSQGDLLSEKKNFSLAPEGSNSFTPIEARKLANGKLLYLYEITDTETFLTGTIVDSSLNSSSSKSPRMTPVTRPQVTLLANGNILIVGNSICGVKGAIISQDGELVTEFTIDRFREELTQNPEIVTLTSNNVLVMWAYTITTFPESTVYGAIYNQEGVLLKPKFTIARGSFKAAILPDNSIFVATMCKVYSEGDFAAGFNILDQNGDVLRIEPSIKRYTGDHRWGFTEYAIPEVLEARKFSNGSMAMIYAFDQGSPETYVHSQYNTTHSYVPDALYRFDNTPPMVNMKQLIPKQVVATGQPYLFTIAENQFIDEDGEPLSYKAFINEDDSLPDWMIFNSSSRTFKVYPFVNYQGKYKVTVRACDTRQACVTDAFVMQILNDGSEKVIVIKECPDEPKDTKTEQAGSTQQTPTGQEDPKKNSSQEETPKTDEASSAKENSSVDSVSTKSGLDQNSGLQEKEDKKSSGLNENRGQDKGETMTVTQHHNEEHENSFAMVMLAIVVVGVVGFFIWKVVKGTRRGRYLNLELNNTDVQNQNEGSIVVIQHYKNIPQEMICPLTKEIMSDPYILVSEKMGFSVYERTAINDWLENNDVDPVNKQKMIELIRSDAIKGKIEEFILSLTIDQLKESTMYQRVSKWIERRGKNALHADGRFDAVLQMVEDL